MADSDRQFFTAQTVRLELLPKALYHHQAVESALYQTYFAKTEKEETLSVGLGEEAFSLAKKYGLAAMDSLNIAAALRLGAEEFITTELPSKPSFRVRGIKVVSLRSMPLGK